jgi:hypothetical protein
LALFLYCRFVFAGIAQDHQLDIAAAKTARFFIRRHPDINPIAFDLAAGVVHGVDAGVFARVDLYNSAERQDARISRDDAFFYPYTATGAAFERVGSGAKSAPELPQRSTAAAVALSAQTRELVVFQMQPPT